MFERPTVNKNNTMFTAHLFLPEKANNPSIPVNETLKYVQWKNNNLQDKNIT